MLGKLVSIRNGADYKASEVMQGGFPVIGSGGQFAQSSRYLFDGESVLFGRKGTIDKPLYVSGKFWTVDTMFYTVLGPRIVGRFLYYFAKTVDYSRYSTNTAVPSMTQRDIATFRVPLPPHDLQRRIADYLDAQTAKIDLLIEKQEQLIEMLAERRQAVISHAVTKGLDSAVKMKDSGIEWVGTIPRAWIVGQVKNAGEVVLGKMIQPAEKAVADFKAPYLRAANVQPDGVLALDNVKTMWFNDRELAQLDLRRGDVVVVEGGMGGFGRSAFIDSNIDGWGFQNSINRVRPSSKIDGKYLTYLLLTARSAGYIRAISSAVSMPHLTAEKLSKVRIPVPPMAEQRAIAMRLDGDVARTNVLAAKAREVIDALKERRQALISAAVTGKIDVRGLS